MQVRVRARVQVQVQVQVHVRRVCHDSLFNVVCKKKVDPTLACVCLDARLVACLLGTLLPSRADWLPNQPPRVCIAVQSGLRGPRIQGLMDGYLGRWDVLDGDGDGDGLRHCAQVDYRWVVPSCTRPFPPATPQIGGSPWAWECLLLCPTTARPTKDTLSPAATAPGKTAAGASSRNIYVHTVCRYQGYLHYR